MKNRLPTVENYQIDSCEIIKQHVLVELVGAAYRNSKNTQKAFGLHCFNQVMEVAANRGYVFDIDAWAELLDTLVFRCRLSKSQKAFQTPEEQRGIIRRKLHEESTDAICEIWYSVSDAVDDVILLAAPAAAA